MKFLRLTRSITLLLSVMIASAAVGQTVTGSITGTVTDTTGAVVVGAAVTAKNVLTSVETPTTSNGSGVYSIRFLPIGQYQVTVSAPGFENSAYPPFELEVNQTAKVDARLKAGAVSTTTLVQGALAPILNTNDASLGLTLTSNQLQTIPLNGRNFASVTLFIPGSVSTNGPQGMTGNNAIERNTFYSGTANINGNRAQANNYTLDGIDMNENQNNLIAYNPAPDALQQIKVITANAPAQYGNVNGGDVISVLKSGTNRLHGSAYAFLQNQQLNANSWTNNHAVPIIPINPYTQTQFGGTIGGPIKHNKLFFFADYEGAREHTGGISTASVFTPAMRAGDFSVLLNPPPGTNGATNAPIQLYDTQNNFVAYSNNQIPIVNPVAKFIFAHPELYPLPNATPQDGVIQNNFQGPNRTFTVNNQGDIKIEWDPKTADKITGFYSQSNAHDGNIPVLQLSFPAQNVFPTKLGGGMWVHVFSPAVVNSARVGFTRVVWVQSVPTDPSGQFGLNGNSKVGITFPAQQYVGFSFQGISPLSGVGTPANIGSIIDNTYSYGDDLTWQHGLHLISLGVQAVRYQNNYITSNNQGFLGAFNYNGNFTGNPNPGAIDGTGYAGADFVLDRVSSANVEEAGVLVGQRQWRTAGFVQDDWKILPNLTINLGLRYEYDQPWYEVNNKTANVILSGPKSGTIIYGGRIPVGALPGAQLCSNRACYQPTYNQIMPRIGFAYQPRDRFVIRGGYGTTSFFEGNAANQRLTSLPPFIQSSAKTALAPAAPPLPPGVPAGGTPYTVEEGFSSNPSDINFSGGGYGAWPQNMQPAYIQEFSLTLEYELSNTTSLQVGYIGETGQHLIDYRNANQLTVPGDPTTAPYANMPVVGGQTLGTGALLLTEPEAKMNYNALQAVLRHRASHGLEYTVNYTYSKTMTNSLGNYGLNVSGFSGAFQNGYNGAADVGPAGTDVRHNVSALGAYALPFGHGRQYGSTVNRFEDAAIGGWSISGSLIAYSGFPVTITSNGVSNTNTYGQQRANQYRKLKIVHRDLAHWFGTDPSATPCPAGVNDGVCAYGAPAPNTFGTASVGSERAPGYLQVDASAFKDFHTIGNQALGFRADGFNVFNISSYGNPDSNVLDGTYGQINSVRSPARIIQLSLHYTF